MVASAMLQTFTPTLGLEVGYTSGQYFYGNLADVRVSNVARYGGTSFTVPTAQMPFATDSNTLLLLKSLGNQVGQTFEVQGRGLQSTSVGATRTVQSYPPAPMSSYLLDTTSNSSVTYGQGKYVASASSELATYPTWTAFDKSTSLSAVGGVYSYWTSTNSASQVYTTSGGVYLGSVTTVDTIGNAYLGEWLQIQTPVSVLLTNYVIWVRSDYTWQAPVKFWILGSRDGTNWTLTDSRSGTTWASPWNQTFTIGATQAYNFYRMVVNTTTNGAGAGGSNPATILEWTLNGTEESLCITNDAKVGVGIANPQRSLEVAGDLVVGGTISGGAGMGGFRNRIINGDMRIAQRGTSNVIPVSNPYLIDRFNVNASYSAGTITQYQSALAASDGPYQLGFRNYMNVYVSVGMTASYIIPGQNIEGYSVSDFNWGTSFGSPATVSFWFRTNTPAGSQFTYSLQGSSGTVSYAGTFVPTQGIWQYWTFTVPPPPNGTSFGTGTNAAFALYIAPYYPVGVTSTVNAWNTSSYQYVATGTYNWPALAGNFIHVTGVQLEKGTVASPFEFRNYAQELALCQRYYQKSYDDGVAPGTATGTGALQAYFTSTGGGSFSCNFPVKMRVDPTVVAYSSNSGTAGKMYSPGPAADFAVSVDKQSQQVLTIYAGATLTVPNYYYVQWTANAEI